MIDMAGGMPQVIEENDVAADEFFLAQGGDHVAFVEQKGDGIQVEVVLLGSEQVAEKAGLFLLNLPAQPQGDGGKIMLLFVEVDGLALGQIDSHKNQALNFFA